MMRKIYSKLFKFTPSKSWYNVEKTILSSSSTIRTIISQFYNEYTLEYINGDIFWYHNVYNGRSTYHNSSIDSGVVTLNIIGKIIFTVILYIISNIILHNFTKINMNFYIHLGIIATSYLLSYIAISIFNWKIYRTFRRAKYAANNVKKIQRKEEEERLNEEIINVVNRTIARDPKLSRKIKLNQIDKKYFWQKWFKKEDKSYDGDK